MINFIYDNLKTDFKNFDKDKLNISISELFLLISIACFKKENST